MELKKATMQCTCALISSLHSPLVSWQSAAIFSLQQRRKVDMFIMRGRMSECFRDRAVTMELKKATIYSALVH